MSVASASGNRTAAAYATVLFIASMATLVQAYVTIKLTLLLLFLACAAVLVAKQRRSIVFPRLIAFYLAVAVAGIVWSIVGLLNPGTFVAGVYDALRLYGIWSLAFLILFSLLRALPSLRAVHYAMVLAAVLIALINFVALADQILRLGLLSDSVRVQMELYVGIHDGYVQITSNNIGALFMIVPYLLAIELRADADSVNDRWTRLALVLSLLISVASGRRALWLVIALTPFTLLALAYLTGSVHLLKRWGRRLVWTYAVAAIVGVTFFIVTPRGIPTFGFVDRVKEGFSSQDERSIQKPFLTAGFAEKPLLGTGFGAAAGYLRDYERPWTGYELTYYQLAFNLGIVGYAVLLALFGGYFVLAVRNLRKLGAGSAIPFGLLMAFASQLVGAYSNRYFGSFDLLFFVGFLPYLASLGEGAHEVAEPVPQPL
ncbi:MAG TPA: hypothetical protein VKH19_17070 [Gemmatimonadaceae bacterium]|nr:hypothetical protein [Gemmatimonadaceae bacterium]